MLLADGTTTVSDGQTITATELQGLQFKPAADANGNTSFSFSVTDSGSTDLNAANAQDPLSDLDLIQQELKLRADLSGDGTTGVKVSSKLSPLAAATANTGIANRAYGYQSSAGLLLSDNSNLAIDSPTALSTGGNMLMLNESGTAGFSIPSTETFMGARVLSNNTGTMAIAVNPPATDVAVMNGFSVYTSEAGANPGDQPIYRRYSFAANGELEWHSFNTERQ